MNSLPKNLNIVNPKATVSQALKEHIGIYRKKYIYQEPDLFTGWRTSDYYLTDSKIEAGVFNQIILGIFLTNFPTAFCVDIDDHYGKGEGYLLSVYSRVVSYLSYSHPSILCKTPHGLHAYYFLEYPVHINVLIPEVKNRLSGVPVEVKPTHNIGGRIPRAGSFLDTVTLEPIEDEFREIFYSAVKYHPTEIFSDNIQPHELRKALKDRQFVALRIREGRTLAKFEAQDIGAGQTNQFLCDLIPLYRTAGIDPENAALRFTRLLSKNYSGELRDYRRLVQRIKSFYRHTPPSRFTAPPERLQHNLFTEKIADSIAGTIGRETVKRKEELTKKRRTVKKAVIYLENWKAFIDDVKKNRTEAEYWNYLYPFFKKNTSEGFYPIPSNLFLKLHGHYEWYLLPHLKQVGYLERSPYGYSNAPDKTTCYHWKINGEQFM